MSAAKKKNLIILTQNGYGGGAERMAANMSLALSSRYEVYYILFDGEGVIYPYGGHLVDMKLKPEREASFIRRIFTVIKRTKKLYEYKRDLKPAAVISHLDGPDLVNVLSGKAGNRMRCISVYHSMPSVNEKNTFAHRLFHRFIAAFSDRYVMVSKPAKKDMHENFGVPLKKLSVIYNFSDTGKIKRLIKEDLPADFPAFKKAHKKLIVSTGRMERVKRQERLIKLLGRIRNEKGLEDTGLVILGDGPERERIVSEAEKLSLLSHVYAPGNVSNPFKYMALCDLFVLCSDYEGLPMVLTEAAACRLPSVSADMPSGAREILAPDTDPEYKTDGVEYARFGVLTRPFEYAGGENFLEIKEDKAEEHLFSGVLRLLTDSELYESYRSKAPALAARFSEERMLGIWLGLIRRR